MILIAGLYCTHFYREDLRSGNILVLFALGLLGSLTRSDFGLLPFSIWAATLFVAHRIANTSLIREAFAGFVGAALGIELIFIHNFIITDTFLQSSALMKGYSATWPAETL